MKVNNNKYVVFVSVMLFLLQLVFLYVVKYANQGLTLSEFSFSSIGNIFNLTVYLGIIVGIYVSLRLKMTDISAKIIFAFLILTWILLIVSFVSTKFRIIPNEVYYFGQPGDKILSGLLFFLFLFSLIYFLLYTWSNIISKKRSSFFRTIYSTILIFIFFFILIIVYMDNIGYSSGKWVLSKSEENIAIVLGAAVWTGNIPSPTLSSRVDKALELMNRGFAGRIVFTGGKAPGELSEAEVAYEYAKVNGADTTKIIKETYTSSTADQIKWIKNNLSTNENYDCDEIIISDRYHLPRVIEISKFFNLDIKVAESTHKLAAKDALYNKIREGIALFNFWNFAL
jgi:vancomycin permeability regulator SanA